MNKLNNRRILLGVTGGIAAYKSADLIRKLTALGADVRVVMTKGAEAFITPLTLQALSGNNVHTALLDTEAERAMGHIELAKWADLILVAPASANFLARLNAGLADDLLTTLCLATTQKIALAPAMNQAMWRNAATTDNVNRLSQRGITILGPGIGEQACGDTGPGRMIEVEEIILACGQRFQPQNLDGLTVTLTAGPTQEAIDPVRYISNHSSGKMGFAIAKACIDAGASVNLITGPVALSAPDKVTRIDVLSAEDMLHESLLYAKSSDIFIACAAVADYKPSSIAHHKIKKHSDTLTLNLTKNPDIISAITDTLDPPFAVGFAAETENLLENAKNKLTRKKLNVIVANDVSDKSIGFGTDHNAVTFLTEQAEQRIEQSSKTAIAEKLVNFISIHYSDWRVQPHPKNYK